MMQCGYGRVVNLSSGGGSFDESLGLAAYVVSKTALHALTVKVFQVVHGDVKVNAMCPGWVRTDIGAPVNKDFMRMRHSSVGAIMRDVSVG